MASWIVHFRIADKILDYVNLSSQEFIVGSIGADCGEANENFTQFTPSSNITHWTKSGKKSECDYEAFYNTHLTKELTLDKFSFYLGYYVHLLTDVLWVERIAIPTGKRFSIEFDKDLSFIAKVKKDWYDLDHLFLKENPNFRAFKIFSSIKSFPNKYLEYYSELSIENQIKYITNFYNSIHDDLYREYIYLKKDEMDKFVENTSNDILKILKEKGIFN